MGFLKKLFSGPSNNENETNPVSEVVITEATTAQDNNEELIAVIAAALAATMGLNLPDINIQSIRRIPQNTTTWADMSRKEQMLGKL